MDRSSQKTWEVRAELFNIVMALQKEGFFAQLQQSLQGQGEVKGVGRDDVQTAVLAECEVSQRRSCHSSRKPCWNYPSGQEWSYSQKDCNAQSWLNSVTQGSSYGKTNPRKQGHSQQTGHRQTAAAETHNWSDIIEEHIFMLTKTTTNPSLKLYFGHNNSNYL